MSNRETWLLSASEILGEWIAETGAERPSARVSVGYPTTGARSKVIGQCCYASADGVAQVFIHPTLDESARVLDVLLHELIHASLGAGHGHGKAFKRVAEGVGLTGLMTATVAGEDLRERLNEVVQALGEYPHAKLDTSGTKKQTTRLIKCECEECGYVARTSMKWLEEWGAPICPCSGEVMTVC